LTGAAILSGVVGRFRIRNLEEKRRAGGIKDRLTKPLLFGLHSHI